MAGDKPVDDPSTTNADAELEPLEVIADALREIVEGDLAEAKTAIEAEQGRDEVDLKPTTHQVYRAGASDLIGGKKLAIPTAATPTGRKIKTDNTALAELLKRNLTPGKKKIR